MQSLTRKIKRGNMSKTKLRNTKAAAKKQQRVTDIPAKERIGKYLTKKGLRLIANSPNKAKEIWQKYGKVKYVDQPTKILKTIQHK